MPCFSAPRDPALESRARLAALASTSNSCNRTEPANARAPLTWKMSRTRYGPLGHPTAETKARPTLPHGQLVPMPRMIYGFGSVWRRSVDVDVDLSITCCPLVPQLSLSQSVKAVVLNMRPLK
jgi:hypothetical protein